MVSLALLLGIAPFVPSGLILSAYVVLAELLSTYLTHCPAHYLVGRALGIRFRAIRVGKTTLARALPRSLAGLARFFPILTLSTEKSSLVGSSRRKVAAMYASGTAASVGSAVAIALATTALEPYPLSAIAWAIALFYLVFDLVFSPRSGDISRARAALRMLPG